MSLTIQWERVTDINPFLKLRGNLTRSEPRSRTQLALMNLTPEPRPLVTMLSSLWYFYLYTIIYFTQAFLNLVRMELMELFCKESHFLRVKKEFSCSSPKQDNLSLLYFSSSPLLSLSGKLSSLLAIIMQQI